MLSLKKLIPLEKTFDVITLDWKKCDIEQLPEESGVYQIYGDSPIYGTNVLLYIGMSENIKHRIEQHFKPLTGAISRQPNKTCRYALVPPELMRIVEQILIAMHKPSFNSESVSNIYGPVREKLYYIQNHGERGMLHLELTNYYFVDKTDEQLEQIIIQKDVQ